MWLQTPNYSSTHQRDAPGPEDRARRMRKGRSTLGGTGVEMRHRTAKDPPSVDDRRPGSPVVWPGGTTPPSGLYPVEIVLGTKTVGRFTLNWINHGDQPPAGVGPHSITWRGTPRLRWVSGHRSRTEPLANNRTVSFAANQFDRAATTGRYAPRRPGAGQLHPGLRGAVAEAPALQRRGTPSREAAGAQRSRRRSGASGGSAAQRWPETLVAPVRPGVFALSASAKAEGTATADPAVQHHARSTWDRA